jgi:hypothetical protein
VPVGETARFDPGGYRYIRGPFQYSGGVAAEPGYAIERMRFERPLALDEGFARIEAHLRARNRPVTAFCACELRSPAPFSEQGFIDFNRHYVGTLEHWGLLVGDDNPVARSNVCPEVGAPAEPGFFAFSYTVPVGGAPRPSFVVSGSAEVRDGRASPGGSYDGRIVRQGETSPDALRDKARVVLQTMEARLALLGASWRDATATHAYTVYDVYPFLADEIVARGAAAAGLTWVYARPPVVGLDYEMDVRGVGAEYVARP